MIECDICKRNDFKSESGLKRHIAAKHKKKTSEKISNIIILLFLLFSGPALIVFGSYSIEPYSDDYPFFLQAQGDVKDFLVRKFQFDYNFDNNEGSLHFKIVPRTRINGLHINYPNELELKRLKINDIEYAIDSKGHFNISDIKTSDDYDYFQIYGFPVEEDYEIQIEFKGNISPHGRYHLNIVSEDVTFLRDTSFLFELGKYRCLSPCVYNPTNAEFVKIGQTLQIKSKQSTKNPHVSFTIDTFDSKIERQNGIRTSMGISLFISGILFFFSIVLKKKE